MKSKVNNVMIALIAICTFSSFMACNDETKSSNVTQSESNEAHNKVYEIPEEITLDLGNNIMMEFVYIDKGSFLMGSDEQIGDEDESPKHEVCISKPFYMGKYEVTQKQWKQIMGSNNSNFKGDDNPVDTVSFLECNEFAKKLSDITKKKVSLPTEAQWEYACRAGSDTKWFFGDDENDIEEYGWIDSNSNMQTHPVGLKKPNKFGLYDMYGNIQEWCSDWYTNPYLTDDKINPQGPKNGDSKVIRGGAWGDFPDNARSAYRNANGEDISNDGTGFRVVIEIEER